MMDAITDAATGARCYQTMVPMRDGARLNTFVFVPAEGGPRFPVILHRTPYGIAAADARDEFDCARAWLPNPAEPMRGSILRGWKRIVAEGYAAIYQDCRGRYRSEGTGQYLEARHGDTDHDEQKKVSGQDSGGLSAKGKQDATALAEEVAADHDVKKVISSDLPRAVEWMQAAFSASSKSQGLPPKLPWDR